MLCLNWFYTTERLLEHLYPASNVGYMTAMEVRVDWVKENGTDMDAYFEDDFFYCCRSRSGNANKISAATDDDVENVHVRAAVEVHNGTQKKRSCGSDRYNADISTMLKFQNCLLKIEELDEFSPTQSLLAHSSSRSKSYRGSKFR